jgi:hypothetical protein
VGAQNPSISLYVFSADCGVRVVSHFIARDSDFTACKKRRIAKRSKLLLSKFAALNE